MNITQILQQDRENFKRTILFLYENNPPQLRYTNNIVQFIAKDIGISSQTLDHMLEKRRRELIDIASEKIEQLDDDYEVENWNYM